MNKRGKYSLIPAVFEEGFFPNLMRQFTLFDDEDMMPATSSTHSNISLWEDDNSVHLEAHLPGVPEENIELTQDKGVLWIKGEAEKEEKDNERKYYRKATRSFSYHVAMPGNIDERKEPTALYENGVIKITFSKLEQETPKKIQIKTKS